MSKAALISIKPEWVAKILNGEKTIEVRKTAPKLETPFKCYIYCTKDKKYTIAPIRFVEGWFVKKYDETTHYANGCTWNKKDDLNGKVVAEFTCTKIHKVDNKGSQFSINNDMALTNRIGARSRLNFDDMKHYLGTKDGYAWEIENIKFYDQPKGLSEFKYSCRDDHACNLCKYLTVASWDKGNTSCGAFVRRPPQSWCYVEEID